MGSRYVEAVVLQIRSDFQRDQTGIVPGDIIFSSQTDLPALSFRKLLISFLIQNFLHRIHCMECGRTVLDKRYHIFCCFLIHIRLPPIFYLIVYAFFCSLFAICGMISPSAVRMTGVITFKANVNRSSEYIPRIQLAAVIRKHHPPKNLATP